VWAENTEQHCTVHTDKAAVWDKQKTGGGGVQQAGVLMGRRKN